MTRDEILAQRVANIESVPDRFVRRVSASQGEIFAELLELLSTLETTPDGRLVMNSRSIYDVEVLFGEYLQRLRQGRYGSLVSGFLSEMDAQRTLITDYAAISYNGVVSAMTEAVYESARQTAVRQLLGDDFKTGFINVIRDQVMASVEVNATFSEMVEGLRASFTNGNVLGQIVNWTNQVASDRFAIADRSYAQAVDEENGIVFGTYFGGLIKDSRDFCVERAGKVFHRNEVQSWASLEWQGKYRRTTAENILHWLGGYRCQHVFAGRSLASVPKDVIDRNIANGNFIPTEAERRLLNL